MSKKISIAISTLIVVLLAAGLYMSSRYNYLLFHSLAETFSIVIAASIFFVAWNTRKFIQNNYLVYIGIAYIFIAGLDLFHTLSYTGMQIFNDDEFYANQLWISARYLESLSFLIGLLFIDRKRPISVVAVVSVYLLVFILLLSSIFWWKNFPDAYVEGDGQTTFKIVSEYIIIFILAADLYFLNVYRSRFELKVFRLVFWSIALTMFSEFFFTLYFTNYDLSNMIGHYLKIFSYFLVYKAIIETGLSKPIAVFFRELKENEQTLKNLNATKDKMFSILAHDLKSPFNSLIGFSELLMNNYSVFTDEEKRKLFKLINISSRRAHNLLDNLLQWSRTQTGTLTSNPENFNITELIRETIDLLSGTAREKEISMKFDEREPLQVYADHNMISAVLRNLVNNAIKFTHHGGSIAVLARDLGANVQIAVADTGVGMSRETLENLFTLGKYKSTIGTAQEKGSGLGLIICKEFVEKNGGAISANSENGRGSEFRFTLPKEPSS